MQKVTKISMDSLKEVLATVKKDQSLAARITADTDILNEVGLDSVELTDFILRVEECASVVIDYPSLERRHLQTLKTFEDFLKLPTQT